MNEQNRRRHLHPDEMNRAVGMLEVGVRQVDVAERLGTTQSVISRLWRRYRDTGNPRERHLGRRRVTTAIQDRYITLQARRQSSLTATELKSRLQAVHNVTVHTQTIRRRLREVNRGHRVNWAREHLNWTREQWSTILFLTSRDSD